MFVLRRKNLYAVRKYFKGDVLEIGVGHGPDIDFIKNSKGVTSYTGAEREEYYSTYTKDKVNDSHVIYYKGNILPFKNGQFDSVVSIDCIEHVEPYETDFFFNEINRVLKKSGNFIVSAPFVYPEHCEPYDYFRYTRYGLVEKVNSYGFKDVKVEVRSSTLETLLVILNHQLVFSLFPKVSKKTFVVEAAKYALFPITSLLYLTLFIILKVLINIPKDRSHSTFSLGYAAVFNKNSPKK